jgi:type II secretory pathway pseudopilin PulG
MRCAQARRAAGFTLLEMTAALGILTVALLVIAQVGVWSLTERMRAVERQSVEEVAANVLESARATPWEALTPAWAKEQRLPEPLSQQWKLDVQVEPEPGAERTKRITVEISLLPDQGNRGQPVRLVGLISARTTEASGGKP